LGGFNGDDVCQFLGLLGFRVARLGRHESAHKNPHSVSIFPSIISHCETSGMFPKVNKKAKPFNLNMPPNISSLQDSGI